MPTYRLNLPRKLVNFGMTQLIKLGLGPRTMRLLTVPGRRTGRPYTTPVNLVERDEELYLVAPYGAVSWVKNARASGEVQLRRGSRRETRQIKELTAAGAVPVLKDYWRLNSITRPYFAATPDSDAAFLADAYRHPVFRLV